MLQSCCFDEGDTDLLPGTFVSKPDILKYIKDMYDQGKRIPIIKPVSWVLQELLLKQIHSYRRLPSRNNKSVNRSSY